MSTGCSAAWHLRNDEVVGLARVVAHHGGIYASHIRSESGLLLNR
jgi:hypothetical protein